jgi:hypothetical protein
VSLPRDMATVSEAEWNAVQDPSCNAMKPNSCAERVQYSGSGCELAFVRAACGTPFAPSRHRRPPTARKPTLAR